MIRKMESRDLEQVAELEKVCFSEAWSWKLLEAGIHSPYDVYYVFEQDEQILGYCNLRILAGEGEIQRIAVLPPFRRLGVARKPDGCYGRFCSRKQSGGCHAGGKREQPSSQKPV